MAIGDRLKLDRRIHNQRARLRWFEKWADDIGMPKWYKLRRRMIGMPCERGQEIAALRAQVATLREALEDAGDTLRLAERLPIRDPKPGFHDAVAELGRRHGFGALMSTAQYAWREELARNGDWPVGGEFAAGPCYGTVIRTLERIRAALAATEPKGEGGE